MTAMDTETATPATEATREATAPAASADGPAASATERWASAAAGRASDRTELGFGRTPASGLPHPATPAAEEAMAPAASDAAPATPATFGPRETDFGKGRTIGRALTVIGVVGMLIVGIIGFAASYTTLREFAADNGFGPYLAPVVPIGIDVGIISFLAFDLARVRRRGHGLLLLRLAAYGLTLATVTFNASAGGSISGDPVRAALHAVMPLLFVLGVEAARHELLPEGRATDSIPLHRWFLEPLPAWVMYRRMRLANVLSYPEMVRRDKELKGYEIWLRQLCETENREPTEAERLPMTMASRGYTVAEALAMPGQFEAEAEAREAALDEEDEIRREEAAERAHQAQLRKQRRERERELERVRGEGEIRQTEHSVAADVAASEGKATRARRAAELQAQAAERAAAEAAKADESREHAEARARAAEAEKRAAEGEAAAAEERKRAEAAAAQMATEERKRLRVEAELAEERSRLQAANRQAAEAEQAAAEAAEAAAEARLRAAEVDQAAADEEDLLRLPVSARQEYRVARRMLAQIQRHDSQIPHPDSLDPQNPEHAQAVRTVFGLEEIQELLGIGQGQASERRKNAAELIMRGYRGGAPLA